MISSGILRTVVIVRFARNSAESFSGRTRGFDPRNRDSISFSAEMCERVVPSGLHRCVIIGALMGLWCSGNTLASKANTGGSIPPGPE